MADGEIGIRFRYFGIILLQAAMVFGGGVNLLQGHDALVQAHYILVHHLHDLPDESVNAGFSIMMCMQFEYGRLVFLHINTFTSHNASDKAS